MRFRGSRAVVALVVLAAAGCGGSPAHRPTADRSSAAATPAPSATPTVVVDVSADADPSIPPGPPPQPSAPPPGLARAVPADYIDVSATARQNFVAWFDYELLEASLSHGQDADYVAGINACTWRSKGQLTDQIVHLLVSEDGYSGQPAEAILAAALRALCPAGDTGYRTSFDHDVELFSTFLAGKIVFTPPPPTYMYGFFLKETCAAMTTPGIGPTGVFDHIKRLSDSGQLQLSAGYDDVNVLYILIGNAVQAGCPAVYTLLPPVLQT